MVLTNDKAPTNPKIVMCPMRQSNLKSNPMLILEDSHRMCFPLQNPRMNPIGEDDWNYNL